MIYNEFQPSVSAILKLNLHTHSTGDGETAQLVGDPGDSGSNPITAIAFSSAAIYFHSVEIDCSRAKCYVFDDLVSSKTSSSHTMPIWCWRSLEPVKVKVHVFSYSTLSDPYVT